MNILSGLCLMNPLRLRELWEDGQTHSVGEMLVASCPQSDQARWAIAILDYVVKECGCRSRVIDDVVTMCRDASQWHRAHMLFRVLRRHGLALDATLDKSPDDERLSRMMVFAEIVCKVVYNATGPAHPFDTDSAIWIAVCLKSLTDSASSAEFRDGAWKLLISPVSATGLPLDVEPEPRQTVRDDPPLPGARP